MRKAESLPPSAASIRRRLLAATSLAAFALGAAHAARAQAVPEVVADGVPLGLDNSAPIAGVQAINGGSITGNDADIIWSGTGQTAVDAASGGTITLTGGSVTQTADSDSVGLRASGAVGRISTDNVDVSVTSDNAIGAYALNGGVITLQGGEVRATGANSTAVQVENGGIVTASGTDLVSSGGPGVRINNGGSFVIDNGEITSTGPTFAASFTGAGAISFRIGDDARAVSNDGTLLEVSRTIGGGDGTVNLVLGQDSTSSGDIRDAGWTTGWTDVVVENGVQWTGKVDGIRSFVSLQDSDIGFADGSSIRGDLVGIGSAFAFDGGAAIGGNVILQNGSTTSGGTVGNPIRAGHAPILPGMGNVFVDPTSALGGNWDIAGNLTVAGTLSPGNSIGVVTVGGNHAFLPGSTYEVEINAAGAADRLDVAGIATLDGTVRVVPLNGPNDLRIGQPYTIVTAGGGFGGTQFDGAVWNHRSAFLDPSLSYDANNAFVSIERNGVAFAAAAETRNQTATAEALDGLPFGNGAHDAVALSTMAEARQAFDALSGEIHASAKGALLDDSRHVREAVTGRVRQALAPGAQAPEGEARAMAGTSLSAWAQGFGSWGELDGNRNAAQLDRETGGFVVGVDGPVGEKGRLGVAAGYSHSSYDADRRRSSATVDSYHLAAYGGVQLGNVGVRVGAAQSWHDVDTKRSVSIAGFSDRTSAAYNAWTTQVFGEVGYGFDVGGVGLEPFAGVAYANLHTDEFRERGGDAALRGDERDRDIGYSTLGLRATTSVPVSETMTLGLNGMVGWRHAYGDVTPSAVLGFAAGGSAFKIEGAPIARDAAVVEAGLSLGITETASVGLSYSGQLADDAEDHGVTANLTVRF